MAKKADAKIVFYNHEGVELPLTKFGDYLEGERLQRGLSVRAFADMLSCTHSYYLKFTHGAHQPSLVMFENISVGLGLSLPAVLQLAEYDLHQSTSIEERATRVARLVEINPRAGELIDHLYALPIADLDAILSKIENDLGLIKKRRQGS